MTLARLMLAMAVRAVTTRAADGVRCASDWALAVLTLGEGLPACDIADLHHHVAEAGARISGVVVGCGCTDASPWACEAHAPYEEPCRCQCHDAGMRLLIVHSCLVGMVQDVRSIREALAARPKPEDDMDDDDDALDYGVTAPGGVS